MVDPDQVPLTIWRVAFYMPWQSIETAPFDRDLALAVLEAGIVHALVFPCRRHHTGWLKCATHERVEVHPTHWQEWKD